MAGKSDPFELEMLKLLFNGTTISGVADNTATNPLASLYLALHTADPTDAGTQTSSECTYTGYARVAVARTNAGFAVSQNNGVTQAAVAATPVNFPQRTDSGATQTATFLSVGKANSGAGEILYVIPINPSIAINQNTIPQITSAIFTED